MTWSCGRSLGTAAHGLALPTHAPTGLPLCLRAVLMQPQGACSAAIMGGSLIRKANAQVCLVAVATAWRPGGLATAELASLAFAVHKLPQDLRALMEGAVQLTVQLGRTRLLAQSACSTQ